MAQPAEELTGVTARSQSAPATKHKKKTTASISLPFFDDFSYNQHYPDTSLWEDANVYVNQTYAQSPPTLGVATFDGLNKDGLPYDLQNLNTDSTDVLTSKGIDLSNTIDTVFLSFFWQAGGLGERPETTDSLNLKFYSPQQKQWYRVWGISGVDSTGFNQVMVPVLGSQFLRDGFKFRFTAYGAQAGAFDTWNIDYVRIDDQRTRKDTSFKDVAFTRPHPSLLDSLDAIPWFHYNSTIANIYNKKNLILYYRRNTVPGQTYNLDLCAYRISSNGTLLASGNGVPGSDNGHAYFVETGFSCALAPFNLPSAPTGEFEINAYQTYSGNQVAENANDTIRRRQVFKNYYSLDDGTAERAYQVRDNRGGFIISKFDIAAADSIKGLYIYFMPSQYDIEDNRFSIVIYENNNNLPGNLIYESDSLYTPRYTSTNFLLPYQLDIPSGVWVTGPVFIGIRQVSNVRLPIGFDMNTRKRGRRYYGTKATLTESFIAGNLMMRPYLRYKPKDLDIPQHTPSTIKVGIYPNPASNLIHIETEQAHTELQYFITAISGKVVQKGTTTSEIHLGPEVQPGVYLLQLQDPTGKKGPVVKKILVKR